MIVGKLMSLSRPKSLCPLASSAIRSVQTSWRTLVVIVLMLVLAATTLMLAHFSVAHLHGGQVLERLPYPAIPRSLVEDLTETTVRNNLGLLSVRDVVAFPNELMLMIAVVDGTYLPSKYELHCLFGQKYKTEVVTTEWKDDLRSILTVRCKYPPAPPLESQQATVLVKDSNIVIPSRALYATNTSWTPLVYEALTLANSVLLFVKGLLDHRGKPYSHSKSLHDLSCCFGASGKTAVIGVAQEVVRCELPAGHQIHQLQGTLISLDVPNMELLPSVAYFDVNPLHQSIPKPAGKMFYICSCTMLWNEAQFLREWVLYHGFLGIERWFIYDNNSEDNVEEVLAGLQALKYNVTRHAWPWIKTQEAAFSHCALRARADCEWVLFTDVDEFVYPVKELGILSQTRESSSSTWQQADNPPSHVVFEPQASSSRQSNLLRRLIQETLQTGAALGKNIGEVRLNCHNFGPSGLLHTPEEGVLLGYTCRMKHPQRHKSFVLLEAMSESLKNAVHHFYLREGYEEMAVRTPVAVINHYKYQAWEIFKSKFVRRAATYVVDWQEQTAQTNDRAPGLGPEAIEPPDWPARYCEEEDLGLRNFTWKFFRHPQTRRLPWQAPRLDRG